MLRAGSTPQKEARRAHIVLAAAKGLHLQEIAAAVGVSRHTARLWRNRYMERGLSGLDDDEGRGRKCWLKVEVVNRIVTEAVRPPAHRTRWSCRTMAKHLGVSKSTVQRVWSANDIRPHRLRTFKLSKDRHFEEKFWDVMGLYLNPPDKALVLCCDEKSQCQALERTQPGLPLGVGHIRTRTHDYRRHGTVTLFAALNYLDGKIISRIDRKHTHREWLRFLKTIDRETPAELDLHLILDNYSTHKDDQVRAWLTRHPRFHLHFTPTSASWMNLVERFFSDITTDVVREGSFTHVQELIDAIVSYLTDRNQNPRRYIWKAEGQKILEKISAARAALQKEIDAHNV